jgi:2-polyprenyl-6-hydroxyphenyl methylase/3-demethylubiquinone-9 3-methyltransferase
VNEITFSFGRNWGDFLENLDDRAVEDALSDLDQWLGDAMEDAEILDIGSGSGLSSLCMHRRGCKRLVSFDVDVHSVEATKELAGREGSPENWEIFQGSILDESLPDKLGSFSIVHSWGVLHHTGELWTATDHAIRFCDTGGLFFISVYAAGDRYEDDLALKRRFNASDDQMKEKMVLEILGGRTVEEAKEVRSVRGMNAFHDAVDWLGGLPYEVAHVSEIVLFGIARGLRPIKVYEMDQGACSSYLFRNDGDPASALNDRFEWNAPWSKSPEQRTLQEQIQHDLARNCRNKIAELEFRRRQMDSLKSSARRCLGIIKRRLTGAK